MPRRGIAISDEQRVVSAQRALASLPRWGIKVMQGLSQLPLLRGTASGFPELIQIGRKLCIITVCVDVEVGIAGT